MINTIVLALALATASAAADETQDRWNLADLYPTVKAWQDDAATMRSELKAIAACRGHLAESAQRLRGCFERYTAAAKRLARLEVYAEELLAEDTGVPESIELSQQARVLGTELSQTAAFMRPELLRAGAARIHELFAADKALGIYRHRVDNTLRMAPHTLDAKGENLVATFDLARDAAGAAYQILANADMPWPTLRLADGRELKLDQSGYEVGREAPNRDDRKRVFDAFWGQWKEYERTF